MFFKFLKVSLIALLFFGIVSAQEENEIKLPKKHKSEFWKKVRFGGGFGLNVVNGFTNVSVSPSGLYQISDSFGIGVGLNANYSKQRNRFEATVLGASIISIFRPIQEVQLSIELEKNNVSHTNLVNNNKTNYWQPSLFLGAGYSVGRFGAIGIRYDVLFAEGRSPYGTAFLPFVRVFF